MSNQLTASEKNLLNQAPYWVQAALAAADGHVSSVTTLKETRTLARSLASNSSTNVLVKAVISAEADPDKATQNATAQEADQKLKRISRILSHVDAGAATGFRHFLLQIGQEITEAASENLLGLGNKVSDEESVAMKHIKAILGKSQPARTKRATHKSTKQPIKESKPVDKQSKVDAIKAAAQRKAVQARAAARKAKKATADATEGAVQRKAVQARAKARKAAKATTDRAEAGAARMAKQAAATKAAAEAKHKAAAKVKAKGILEGIRAKKEAERAAKAARKYTVKAGDSLSAISLEMYGTANRWKEIAEANKEQVPNPNMIQPGMELIIP